MATWNEIRNFNPNHSYHYFMNTYYVSGDLVVDFIGFRCSLLEQIGKEKVQYCIRFKDVLVYEEVSESWALNIEDLVKDDVTVFQTKQGCLYKVDNSIFKKDLTADLIVETMLNHYELVGIDFVLRVIAREVGFQKIN